MSVKSCGINDNKPQYMLGSNMYKNRVDTTSQLVNAIKKNKQDMIKLQKKTEHLEQSLLMQRSLEAPDNKQNIKEIDEKFGKKLDLIHGDFKEQMRLLKNYIQALEQKIRLLENKIKKTSIPKKSEITAEKQKPSEIKPSQKSNPSNPSKPNVTLEIEEK